MKQCIKSRKCPVNSLEKMLQNLPDEEIEGLAFELLPRPAHDFKVTAFNRETVISFLVTMYGVSSSGGPGEKENDY